MKILHEFSKEIRSRDGFDDGLVPTTILTLTSPDGFLPPLVFDHGINNEHRARLRQIAPLLRLIGAQCVILCSDSLTLNVEKFCKEFDVRSDHNFLETYQRIMEDKFDGTMAKLPNHLRIDALVTSMKGPKVPLYVIGDYYTRGDNGEVIYSALPELPLGQGIMNVIPDWWDVTVN